MLFTCRLACTTLSWSIQCGFWMCSVTVMLVITGVMVRLGMQETEWQLQLASLIKEAVEAVTPDHSISSPSSILNAVLDPLSARHEQQSTRTLLAAGLCQVMGFQPVLLRDTPRYTIPTLPFHLHSFGS